MTLKTAIIGSGGFIGINLVDFFSDKNIPLILIDRFFLNNDNTENIKKIVIDINNTDELIEKLKDCENVIWLASTLVPGSDNSNLIKDFETNVSPVVHFLEKAKEKSQLKNFIYLSSGGTVYGNIAESKPVEETYAKNPISAYGLSKLITEEYIRFVTQNANFQSIILRPSNVYGRHQNMNKPQGIVGFAFRSILNNTTLDLYNDGKVIRDFIHVNDLCNAIYKCLDRPIIFSQTATYNVGSGIGYSIKEIIHKINEVTNEQVNIIPKTSRAFDCEFSVLNIEKISRELDWQPLIDINNGLNDTWQWIKSQ